MTSDYDLTMTPVPWSTIFGWGACQKHSETIFEALGENSITALQVIEVEQSDWEAIYRSLWLLERTDKRTAIYVAMELAKHSEKQSFAHLETMERWLRRKASDQELNIAMEGFNIPSHVGNHPWFAKNKDKEYAWQRSKITEILKNL